MISYVAKILCIFATSVQNVILFTSVIGETIITALQWICSTFIYVSHNVLLFFQIVYEDNLIIFTEDLPNALKILCEIVSKQLLSLWTVIDAVYYGISYKLSAIASNIIWSLNATSIGVQQVVSLMKNTLIHFGNTVWFILTFLPIHVPQLLQGLARNLWNIFVIKVVDGYMSLLQFTNFLTEVPLESFLGISIFIIVTRLCIYFRTTIVTQIIILYWAFLRSIMYYFYMFYNYFTNSEVRVITQMANGEELQSGANFENDLNDDAANSVESLCVICQERQKCVLTLPCRHVCLCTDCCRRLYGYQRTCPICRTFIYHSVTIYL